MRPWFVLPLLSCGLLGCGADPASICKVVNVLLIGPSNATVNSSARAPANQQIFVAGLSEQAAVGSTGCGIPAHAVPVQPTWTNPDPIHITISSAADATNGTATCEGPTDGAVTLTAAYGSGTGAASGTATLTCK